MQTIKNIEDFYFLCLCEGSAELAIMEILLENQLLLIKKEDLIYEKIHSRYKVRTVEEKFLTFDFEKPVKIIRILDSRNEQFNLKPAFKDRFEVENYFTPPEIEILFIIANGDFDKYSRRGKIKPNIFCKENYSKDIKKYEYVKRFFSDPSKLLKALSDHKRYYKNIKTIDDLLRK